MLKKVIPASVALLGLLAAGAAFLISCPPTSVVADVALVDTVWTLESIGFAFLKSRAVGGATLEFSDQGVYHGSAGCNSYSGHYAVAGSTLRTLAPIHDLMGCDADTMRQERAFLLSMGAVVRHRMRGRQLTLYCSDGRRLVFRASDKVIPRAPATPTPFWLEIVAPQDGDILENQGEVEIRVRGSKPFFSVAVDVVDLAGHPLGSENVRLKWLETQEVPEGSGLLSFTWPRPGTRADIIASTDTRKQVRARDMVTVMLEQGDGPVDQLGAAERRLYSRQWTIDIVQDGPLRMPIGVYPRMNARFHQDGTLEGSLTCFEYSASFRVTSDRLSVAGLKTWPRRSDSACRPLTEWEELFLKALSADSRFSFDVDRLQIEAGDVRVEFRGELVE